MIRIFHMDFFNMSLSVKTNYIYFYFTVHKQTDIVWNVQPLCTGELVYLLRKTIYDSITIVATLEGKEVN